MSHNVRVYDFLQVCFVSFDLVKIEGLSFDVVADMSPSLKEAVKNEDGGCVGAERIK